MKDKPDKLQYLYIFSEKPKSGTGELLNFVRSLGVRLGVEHIGTLPLDKGRGEENIKTGI